MITLPVQPYAAEESPRLLSMSLLFEPMARNHARRLSADPSVSNAYVTPGRDSHGTACFHVWYRPAYQFVTLRNGDRVRRVYGDVPAGATLYREP